MRLFLALMVLLGLACREARAQDGPTVVLLTDCNGYVHEVVKPTGGDSLVKRTIASVVQKLGGTLVHTDDASKLTAEVLDPAKTQVLVMYTTGDLPLDLDLLNKYIEDGGTLLGIHCATDTLMSDERFFKLIGGSFDGHPWNANTDVVLKAIEPDHPVVAPIGRERALKEEIYLHKNFDPATVRVLMVLDMIKTELKHPQVVPIVWVKQVGKGRVLYTSLGHNAAVWESDWYQSHLENGFKWLLGDLQGPAEPNPEATKKENDLTTVSAQLDAAVEEIEAQAEALGDQFLAENLAASQEHPATQPTTRPHDPWVFRCVLDGRPRVVVAALSEDLWIAYDATTCGLYKAWSGGMDFTGSVYDDKHGPQPQTQGTLLSQFTGATYWQVLRGDSPVEAAVRYAGYTLNGTDSVRLTYRFALPEGEVTVTETPEAVEGSLRRVFEVKGLPEGYSLQFPLSPGSDLARATHASPDARMIVESGAGGDLSFLRLEKDGPAHLFTRWARPQSAEQQQQAQPVQQSSAAN